MPRLGFFFIEWPTPNNHTDTFRFVGKYTLWLKRKYRWYIKDEIQHFLVASFDKIKIPIYTMYTVSNIVAAFWGMHVSPAKHSYAWLPRKCDYRTDRQTDRQTERRTDRRQTKWFLCAAMLRRWQKYNAFGILKILMSIKTRGPKGHISFTWVQCATSFRNRPRRTFLFTDRSEKHKLCRGHWDLASCQVSLNSVQRFQRRSGKCLSQSAARAAILFFRSARITKTW